MNKSAFTFRPFLIPTLTMLILGWGGLYSLINFTLPTLWPRWAFFFLTTLALTGSALPFVYFFHQRFNQSIFPTINIIRRQALWAGVFGSTLAWLQLGQVANLSIAIGLAIGILAIEALIRLREKSQWTPPEVDYD